MSNLNSPVPQILNTTGMNPALQNLFQTYSGGDASGASAAQAMFDKYAGQLLNNISWDFNITYTGQAEQDANKQESDAAMNLAKITMNAAAPPASYPGQFQAVTQVMGGPGAHIYNNDSAKDQSQDVEAPKPSPYDWKQRTSQICQQVAARGLTPSDFGCVDASSVSENFSWRGNAKMICTRIATLYDPSIPASCGCPPVSWAGWRS